MPAVRRLAPAAFLLLALANPAAAQGTIRGVVHDSLFGGAPLGGATIVLRGAPNTAVTDRMGRFVIRDVPAGTYQVGFFHPLLDSLEVSAPMRSVAVKDGETVLTALGMPTAASLSLALCGRELEPASSVVFGIVRDAEGEAPMEGAVVRAHWYVWQLVAGVGREAQRVEMDTTAADGRYVLCGVPNDIELSLWATEKEQMTGKLPLALDHQGIGRRDLMVSRTDTASRVPPPVAGDDTIPWQRPAGSAHLVVTVLDDNGRPVPGATVGVRGTRANGRTGNDGVVRFAGVASGTQPLLVRRPGAVPVTTTVALRAGAENTDTVRLGKRVTALPTVAVTSQRTSLLEREMRTRLQLYNGTTFDAKETAKLATGGLSAWIRVTGMRVVEDGFDALPVMQSSRMQPCQPNLWYEGARIYNWSAWELRTLLIGASRVEVYPRPANQPPQFLTENDCGSILVWR